ncbi:MAG: hypothetical protein MJD61_12640 [Proteobacteria bacterium]|nr:hypothetical protein [Pseudomonadota bacterium]
MTEPRQVQLATRVDRRVKRAVDRYCEGHGVKLSRFVEDALLDRLEELEDIEDLKALRAETTRPLEDILRELKLDELL